MTLRGKLIVSGALMAIAAAAFYLWPRVSFQLDVARALREQSRENAAVKPRLDATVTKKLKVGDSLAHAKKVLSDAGLESHLEDHPPRPVLKSILRAGRWSGFSINLELDDRLHVAKIDIREYFTAP